MARVHEFEFEMERNNQSVTYVAEFDVTPAERGTPRTLGDPGTPDYPAYVDEVRVYLVSKKRCKECFGAGSLLCDPKDLDGPKRICPTCKGRKHLVVKERREELDDLVSESELLEYAGEQSEGEREDYEADAYDRWMDR